MDKKGFFMKKTIIALALFVVSFAAVANINTFPHVWNNGSSVSFDVWNSSDRDIRCSGPIYLELEDNKRDTVQVYEFVWARRSVYRTYYPNTIGAKILSVSHAVWCF